MPTNVKPSDLNDLQKAAALKVYSEDILKLIKSKRLRSFVKEFCTLNKVPKYYFSTEDYNIPSSYFHNLILDNMRNNILLTLFTTLKIDDIRVLWNTLRNSPSITSADNALSIEDTPKDWMNELVKNIPVKSINKRKVA